MRDATQSDRHLTSRWRPSIASESLWPGESIMRPLCPRKGHDVPSQAAGSGGTDLDAHPLLAHQLHASSSVLPSAPVAPEDGQRPESEGMQEHADLSRFGGRVAVPLTPLTQKARATRANAGSIDDAQAPIGLSSPFMGTKRLSCGTAQGAIGLESKVFP